MKILLCLNHNHFKLYDEFMKMVPEFKNHPANWHELLTQIFISLSNNVPDFLVNCNQLPMMDRLIINDNIRTPELLERIKYATPLLCVGVYFLCNELNLFHNGVFDYTIVYSNDSLVVFVPNNQPG